jgi:uncharacterized protein (DUF2147 family)
MNSLRTFVLGVAMVALAPPVLANSIDGVWLRGDGNARVRIAACGSQICATNLWIGDTSGGEAVGDQLVMSLSPQPDGSLAGTAYDPKRDRRYSLTIRVSSDQLVTRGCLLGRFLCRDVKWTAAR